LEVEQRWSAAGYLRASFSRRATTPTNAVQVSHTTSNVGHQGPEKVCSLPSRRVNGVQPKNMTKMQIVLAALPTGFPEEALGAQPSDPPPSWSDPSLESMGLSSRQGEGSFRVAIQVCRGVRTSVQANSEIDTHDHGWLLVVSASPVMAGLVSVSRKRSGAEVGRDEGVSLAAQAVQADRHVHQGDVPVLVRLFGDAFGEA
jgi:hypothetical protein